jgi:hypothetical protein
MFYLITLISISQPSPTLPPPTPQSCRYTKIIDVNGDQFITNTRGQRLGFKSSHTYDTEDPCKNVLSLVNHGGSTEIGHRNMNTCPPWKLPSGSEDPYGSCSGGAERYGHCPTTFFNCIGLDCGNCEQFYYTDSSDRAIQCEYSYLLSETTQERCTSSTKTTAMVCAPPFPNPSPPPPIPSPPPPNPSPPPLDICYCILHSGNCGTQITSEIRSNSQMPGKRLGRVNKRNGNGRVNTDNGNAPSRLGISKSTPLGKRDSILVCIGSACA